MIVARQPGEILSAAEIGNVQDYIGTGRRVLLLGENNAWTNWNNSILSTVEGATAVAKPATF